MLVCACAHIHNQSISILKNKETGFLVFKSQFLPVEALSPRPDGRIPEKSMLPHLKEKKERKESPKQY